MINQDLYDMEGMYQCKADLLRLEILYKYGGVYIDADMVSLEKSLDKVVSMADDTKFLIMFEPDTKDKPYSVIGNSFIATTPGHPLLRMLIMYIRNIYHHKRPYHGVEWVTGPLAFTKCLVHPDMPMTIPPTSYFYPQFHYVPNPDAINLDMFPDSYAFQFGYTCSGLEGWVKNNNRCKKALDCAAHKRRKDWPFGVLEPFPENTHEMVEYGEIPKVIHQFVFQDGSGKPERWMRTWYDHFLRSVGDGWTYKCWDIESLKGGKYFCPHMYRDDRQMDEDAVEILAMEVIYRHGGYYVPLTSFYSGEGRLPKLFEADTHVSGSGIFGSVAKGRKLFFQLKGAYHGSSTNRFEDDDSPAKTDIISLGYSDASAVYCQFPQWSRFLGAEVLFDATNSKQTEQTMLCWAYDSNVPCYKVGRGKNWKIQSEISRCVVAVDPEIGRFPSLVNSLPGFLKDLDEQDPDWDVLIFGLEWNAGENSFTKYRVNSQYTSPDSKYLGIAFNTNRARFMSDKNDSAFRSLFERYREMKLYVGVQKFEHDRQLAQIFMAIPSLQNAFRKLAGHEAPFEFERYETHGSLLKGFLGDRLSIELSADEESRVMYRSWNDDGGLNSEMKLQMGQASDTVEWMRVYFAHAVIFNANNKQVSV
mmetsp:Transcript_19919/g.79612  ORF Transcript_19919/g.79612 Transcript_19919/m.79612 type:complete len:644 (+) Transcript_19919:629-2560(+)